MNDLELLELNPVELRVFLVLRSYRDKWSNVTVSMNELAEITGRSRSSVSKAVAGLVDQKFIEVVRTKRNYGLLSWNKYKILRCAGIWTSQAARRPENETSTYIHTDSNTTNSNNYIDITTISTNKNIITTQPETGEQMSRWKEEEDDEIGGFGLLEDDVAENIPKINRVPATRHLRPHSDWTARDVASEFASRLYARIPNIPGLINVNNLAGALGRNRKQHGVTATQEVAALDKFFGDERNLNAIRKFPKSTMGMFLNAVTKSIAENASVNVIDEPSSNQYVYASDGKAFDNSMPGRAALQRYEEKLKGN